MNARNHTHTPAEFVELTKAALSEGSRVSRCLRFIVVGVDDDGGVYTAHTPDLDAGRVADALDAAATDMARVAGGLVRSVDGKEASGPRT